MDSPHSPSNVTISGTLACRCASLVSMACSSGEPSENNSPPTCSRFTVSFTARFVALSARAGKVATSSCPTFSAGVKRAITESTH